MNGTNLADPERVQWTQEEYDNLSGFSKFNARHQWLMCLFVYSGIGLITKTLYRGFKFWG